VRRAREEISAVRASLTVFPCAADPKPRIAGTTRGRGDVAPRGR
jgi:hypothetical protein